MASSARVEEEYKGYSSGLTEKNWQRLSMVGNFPSRFLVFHCRNRQPTDIHRAAGLTGQSSTRLKNPVYL